jgi:hypothetical protein
MRKPYCCDAIRYLYEQYYSLQQKGGNADFPVHIGIPRQRGYGIGSLLASLYRRILPFVKSLAPRVLRSGAEIIDGVSKGKTWKQSAKDTVRSQLPEALTKVAFGDETQAADFVGTGRCSSGSRRRKRRQSVLNDTYFRDGFHT